jgi:membrane-bound lytic murein transglycosylase D
MRIEPSLRRRICGLSALLLAAWPAAASTPPVATTTAPPKTLVEEMRASKTPPPAPSAAPTVDLAPEEVAPEGDVAEPPAEGPPAELLNEAEEPALDARKSFDQALAWAQDGVKLHRQGDFAGALKNLHDSRIALLEAGLPEALQERGLSVLDCALGSELGRVDLEALAQDLEQYTSTDGAQLADRDYIEREARRILANFGDHEPREADLATFVEEVHSYVEYYRDKQREFFERSYLRKHKYWPTIRPVFEAKRIPLELGYMALVESGFAPLARSRANARGLWQFIPGTGRRYGLERAEDFYDVQRSTDAAAEYLLDLIGIYGSDSFLLATASYNAGEGRIMGCLRHLDDPFGGRSFWEIRGCLARETREYVPRILAAAIIGRDPKRFGFDLASEDELRQLFDVIVVPRPTRLSTIAAAAGTTVAELRAANSDLSSEAGSTPVRNFPLYVPFGKGEATLAALQSSRPAELAPEEPDAVRIAGRESAIHRIRKGETLSSVAARYHVSIAALARENRLRSPYRLSIGQQLTIPGVAAAEPVRTADAADASRGGRQAGRQSGGAEDETRITYTVQPGNSLQQVAELFSVQYRDLLKWNNLRSRTVKAGQKLVVYPKRSYRLRQHTVRRGETAGEIARRYGIATESVLTANGLGRRAVIHPGAKLRVYVRG